MSLTIGSNIASLNAQRRLQENTGDLSKTFNRLSSGLRINSASDDPAGLSVAATLKSDFKVFAQAARNVSDGVSLLTIADSALESLSQITTRQIELAQQAANGAYTFSQRKALHLEAKALTEEFNRIIESTKFNGTQLLDAESRLNIQAGYGTGGTVSFDLAAELERNVGTGRFATSTMAPTATSVWAVELGDLNNDGHLDLISTGAGGGSTGQVRLGDGSGGFGAGIALSTTASDYNIALGDMNGDGLLDLISTGNVTRLRLGQGNGTFGAAVTVDTALGDEIRLADLNDDGYLDLAVANGTDFSDVVIRLGTGTGTFGGATTVLTHDTGVGGFDFADIDHDGVLDLVIGGYSGNSTDILEVHFGTGNGSFGNSVSMISANGSGANLALGDLNNDGEIDMVRNGEYTEILLGNGDGSFTESSTFALVGNVSLVDLDNDGILDMLLAGYSNTQVRLGNGDGSFQSTVTSSSGGTVYGVGDLNSDGVLDFIAGASNLTRGLATTDTTTISPLLSLYTPEGANEALGVLNDALERISLEKGNVGAMQSRLSSSFANLESLRENSYLAADRILSADIAEETSKMVRLQILQQATTAVLAQANLQPEIALQLLNTSSAKTK